jgi:hypothetical protein
LDSDVPKKRSKQSAGRSALSGHIWELVTGKSKSHYANDVYSDEDDDMEASAAEQAREEARAYVFPAMVILLMVAHLIPF